MFTGTVEALPLEQTLRLQGVLRPNASRVLSISDGTESGWAVLSQLKAVEGAFPGALL
jgi:hypothetical protein